MFLPLGKRKRPVFDCIVGVQIYEIHYTVTWNFLDQVIEYLTTLGISGIQVVVQRFDGTRYWNPLASFGAARCTRALDMSVELSPCLTLSRDLVSLVGLAKCPRTSRSLLIVVSPCGASFCLPAMPYRAAVVCRRRRLFPQELRSTRNFRMYAGS